MNELLERGQNRKAEDGLCWARARDIWIRARTNAFAHQVAARRNLKAANISAIVEGAAIMLPIIFVAVALQYASEPMVVRGRVRNIINTLAILAILLNGVALFLSYLTRYFRWNERAADHQNLLSAYSLIAQKARRLEGVLSHEEGHYLVRHLEETFEINKTCGKHEPEAEDFTKARKLMCQLNVYPFNLSSGALRGDN